MILDIKLIAIDMDGTLLHSDGTVSKKTIETLENAIQAGIYIVPASGRVRSILPDELFKISGIRYALTSNGAAIYDFVEEKVLHENTIPVEEALRLFDIVSEKDIVVEAYINGKGYMSQKHFDSMERFPIQAHYIKDCRAKKIPVTDLRTHIAKSTTGIEKFNMPWVSNEIRKEFTEIFDKIEDVAHAKSMPDNIEVNRQGANKGGGLKMLCQLLNIPLSQTMALGDNPNDMEMLTEAGFSVAMGNGTNEIKEIADFITKTNDEDGVAFAIQKFVL